jgi:hypothetical protein
MTITWKNVEAQAVKANAYNFYVSMDKAQTFLTEIVIVLWNM